MAPFAHGARVASFLSPLIREGGAAYQLLNDRTGEVVVDSILVAFDSASRRTGLLKHTSLPPRQGLIIAPCNSVHTFFMKFDIDVAFVAKDGRIVKTATALRPWRMAGAFRAFATLELAARGLDESGTRPGDLLKLVRRS